MTEEDMYIWYKDTVNMYSFIIVIKQSLQASPLVITLIKICYNIAPKVMDPVLNNGPA